MLSQYYPPDIVGSGTRTHHLVKELLRRDFSVTLITGVPHYPNGNPSARQNRSFYRKIKHGNLTEIRIWMPSASHNKFAGRMLNYFYYCVAVLFLMPLIRNVDIVMAMSPNFFVYPVGLLYKFFKRIPMIANVDDLWPEALEDLGVISSPRILGTLGMIRNQMLRMADHITPISSTITRYLMSRGISKKVFTTIDVGFDTDRLITLPPNDNLSFDESEFKIIYAGMLSLSYDFSLILKLAEMAKSRGKDWRFIIKGTGEQNSLIQATVRKKHLTNVQQHQEYLDQKAYAEFMSLARLFILPMKDNFISSTALPSKLFDFMAFERPVLLLGKGAPAHLVTESRCGLAMKQTAIEDAFAYIEKVENDKEYSILAGRNGREFLEANLSLESIGAKLEIVLSSLLD